MNSCANANTGTKLRGTKSSELRDESVGYLREVDFDKCEKVEKRDKGDGESTDLGVPRGTLVISQRNTTDHTSSRYKARSSGGARNEFRMARGNTGSSGEHGKSGSRVRAYKKSSADRDTNTEPGYHTSARGKLQESLKNQDNSQSRSYDDKRINEDSKIMKLLRRLSWEDDYEHFLGLCKQIHENALALENQRIIRRHLEVICESLLNLLHSGPGIDAKEQVAICLAHIGYATDQDFKRFMEWLFNKYSMEHKDEVKSLLMKSLVEILKLDAAAPKFKDFSVTIMARLQTTLENVDRPDLLISTVDAILLVIDSYPETFSNHFRDSVDILVGWHIDYTQPKAIVSYASRSLQRLRNFWVADLQFTLTLLGQFLEDMESYDEELCLPGSGRSSPGEDASPGPRECILRIASLISVFNTVTKSVAENLNPNITPIVQWSFLTECLLKMLRTVVKAIELNDKEQKKDLVGNNCVDSSLPSTESLTECMRSMNLSQKNIDTLLKTIAENELNEENLFKIMKSLNIGKKGDRKNARIVVEGKDILVKDRERYLINMLKSIDSKRRNNEKNLDLSQEKEELIVVSNECAYLLLGYLQSRVTKNHQLLYKFIDLQLEKVTIFSDETIVSTLNTISKVIREVSANLPLELVHKLLEHNSPLLQLRFMNSIAIQNASLGVYHSLLGLKNIPLLQEAYRYVLADFEIAYRLIVHNAEELVVDNPLIGVEYKKSDAQTVVIFLLRALTDLANASNSIIGMWALKPSILELLAVKLRPYDRNLSVFSPLLQYSILYLLYAHCSRYNHFVRSSSLITGTNARRPIDIFPGALDVPTTSPTSGHLSIILDLIGKAFETKLEERTLSLLSKWMQEVCLQAENYIGILNKTEECRVIVTSLLKRGSSTNTKIALAVCDNLEVLLGDGRAIWPEYVYTGIVDLAMLNLTSYHDKVRTKYGQLLTKVPVNIVISLLNRQCLRSETKRLGSIQNYSIESLIIAERLQMRGTNNNNNTSRTGEMQSQYLKSYMAFLLQDYDFSASDLSEIFTLCWPTVSSCETVARMRELGLTNRSFLYFWSGMEAAHHCVINKLRTPLGKPQETFTTIEGALKTLARETQPSIRNDETRKEDKSLERGFHEHTRVRLFVEFLEHLERSIHNASEGCAVALLPLPKPVRTFFHTNKSTCKEWLNRIRLALCVVSLHAGLSTSALRNSQHLLENLSSTELTQGAEYERAAMCMSIALVKLGETEALQGLYTWTREKDRKFDWLKASVDEAAGRYEAAAERYEKIIQSSTFAKDESIEETGKSVKMEVDAFAMEHLTRCYRATCDWNSMESWKIRETELLKAECNAGLRKYKPNDLSLQQAMCLRKFETNETMTLEELSNWSLLDEKNTGNWSSAPKMLECSNTLMNIAMRVNLGEQRDSFTNDIERCRRVAGMMMEDGLRNPPSEHLTDSLLVQYSSRCLENIVSNPCRSFNAFQLAPSDKTRGSTWEPDCKALSEILWWSDYYIRMANDSCPGEPVASLRLDMIKRARKIGNFNLASREIVKYFKLDKNSLGGSPLPEICTLNDIKSVIIENRGRVKWTTNNMRAFRQISKLLYSMENVDDALRICSATALSISETIVAGEQSSELRETGTRLLLTLAKWIQPDLRVIDNPQLEQLLSFEALHNDGLMDKLFGQTTELIPMTDMIIGKLIQLGVNQCPELPQAWSSFAGWCYKWGHKIVDDSKAGQLTDADRINIRALLPVDIRESDAVAILEILSQNNSVQEDEAVIDTINAAHTSEMIESQLRNVTVLSRASNQHLSMLVDVWRQAQKRIYSYYELSANAYFKYLQLANEDANDCASITATLRLLRLVVKHALELQQVLETGLSTTPTGPWKEIIPQLFSRLSHPEAYVRTRVSDLLCRIAVNTPHLITFPTVVGVFVEPRQTYNDETTTTTPILGGDDDEDEDEDEEDDDENEEDEECDDKDKWDVRNGDGGDVVLLGEVSTEPAELEEERDGDDDSVMISGQRDSCPHHLGDEQRSCMEACFAQLNDCLENGIEGSVKNVKILVKELRRITLLWDELWLATFCQHHREIAKRFEQLELEVEKVQINMMLSQVEKDKLIAEKHRIILTPVIFILENLVAVTSGPAETPHEKLFIKKFGPCIEDVIQCLKSPKNPSRPRLAFAPLKQLEAKLAQRVNKRGSYTLSMADISPVLAGMRDTGIAMPGVSRIDKKIVTIRSVDNNVQILPTKTKPKKLVFHGSDGHVYTYLFKGLEDLHLDERIMQFLSICNTMLSKSNDARKVYRARHYSVIPLGPRSGLIQWVDGVTPLFTLYKRWQQRESTMANCKGGGQTGVMGPSDLFYNKLAPQLKERGIPLENRKEWPLPVLKQVLSDLMAETPNDLLAKEIWCNSINSGNWWQATKNYSYSVAVMSIIGYIIGLGDRHLDNVLVDLNTGEVVHVDYNVCFEKGKILRVPEKVPFRMTPNIKYALGVTGVEGIFRLACEHTLTAMRRGRETLLTLLEAFVYDPLVDWRAGSEHGIATYGACHARARCNGIGRKQLERELTRAMFAVRAAEIRAEWLSNRDRLGAILPLLSRELTGWLEATETSKQCQDLLQDRHQQLRLVKEAQAIGPSHALYTVRRRYATFKRARDAHEKAKAGLKEKMDECEKQISMHNIALAAVRGGKLSRWLAEIGTPSTTRDEHLVFDLVKEFLQNAGQNQSIVQCEQSENELIQLASQQSMLIRSCLDLLSQYSAICSLYPLSMMSQHRSVLYHSWASNLLSTGTLEACHEVISRFEANFEQIMPNDPRIQQTVAFAYQMQAIMNDNNEKFKKQYERMVSEGLPESLVRIEKAFTESKTQITNFLRREKGAERALECVNVTALCALNKRYLMMEGAAKCAGECLVDLTSREGDWFLDEMRLMSSLIVQLASLVPLNTENVTGEVGHPLDGDLAIALAFKCLKSADAIYKGLQELNYNYQMIILPEALKTIVTEEPSVLIMTNELDEIIVSTGLPLSDIVAQLEMHLRFILMDMDSPHAIVQTIVDRVRLRFEALLSRPAENQELNQEESLTPGQMLLMGFNGLFEKLQMEGNALVVRLGSLDIPSSWNKIDQIRDAKEMAATVLNESARRVLDDMFLIKRLQTMQESFAMCREIAAAYKGTLSNVYDDERLNKPVRTFTADYVSRQLLGVTSQTLAIALCFLLQRMGLNVNTEIEQRDIGAESKVSIEELCRKMVDSCMKMGLFSGSVLGQASSISSTLEAAWRRKQTARLVQQSVEVARSSLQRLQLQLTAHNWLHEDNLLVRPNLNPINPLNRSTFMLELRKTAATLSGLQSRVCEAREKQQNLVASVDQRLKWAAGANPALGEVMAAFDNAVLTSCEKLTRQHNLAAIVVNTCNSILHYEALRTRTSESVSNDANFIKLTKQWEESCALRANLTTSVTVIEESLVELLQLDNNVDANWLRRGEIIISDAIVETNKLLQEKQAAHAAAEDTLRERVSELQCIIMEHHWLMTDVRVLLRTMLKKESIDGLDEFLTDYRSFTEAISAVVQELESENLDSHRVIEVKEQLDNVTSNVTKLYDRLLDFANEPTTKTGKKMNKTCVSKGKGKKLVRQDTNVCLSPRKGIPLIRDPVTGKAVQERNVYALNVWRRVRGKLKGYDPNPLRKYTPAEQVEYVIREAQSFDNLALLYEGWTPWV